MARISGYNNDSELTGNDLLVGSSYEGLENGSPKYITRTYKLSDLATYFGGFVNNIDLNDLVNRVGDLEDGIGDLGNSVSLISTTVTNNTSALATAQQSITAITTEVQAQATFKTNLAATFGTFDENGNLTSLSQAFADQVLQTTASDRFAEASFVTNLSASVGTYDENGNLVTLSQSFADQVLLASATDLIAEAEFSTKILSEFGTYNPDGTIATLSEAFANQVFTTTTSERYAEATYVNNIGASLGSINPDGTIEFDINSSYSQDIKTYIENNSALAESVETLQATYATLPVTIRQPDEPAILEYNSETEQDELVYPLGSIWVDTDDNNALYVLIEDAGAPIGYSWSPTTSEALGDLILSNAQLQEEVNLLSTNTSATATKLTTLTAQFGVYDPLTDTFTINNSSNIISSLRTYADAESTSALKVDGINSIFNIVDANGNVIKNLATFNEEVKTYVDQNSATAALAESLRVELEGPNGNDGLIAEVSETSDAVVSKPNVYRQDDPPSGSIPLKSVWYDTNDNNKPYVYEALGWTEARDGRVTELETYARASKTLQATAGGVVTGINIVSEDTGNPESVTSNITFKTSTFNIVDQNDNTKLSFDGSTGSLSIVGTLSSGSVITGATLTGTLTAGNVAIANNDIIIDNGGDIIFRESGSSIGSIQPLVSPLGYGVVYTTGVWEFDGIIHTPSLYADTSISVSGGYGNTGTTLYSNGNISSDGVFLAQDFVLSSDRILKENIKEYTPKPINIQYKTYNIIGDEEKRFGVIAQELEVDHPEFVRENENGIKSVSYIDMLIAKVAELEARIKELEHGNTK